MPENHSESRFWHLTKYTKCDPVYVSSQLSANGGAPLVWWLQWTPIALCQLGDQKNDQALGTGAPIKGRSAVYGVSGELDGPPVPSKESQDPDMDLPQVL